MITLAFYMGRAANRWHRAQDAAMARDFDRQVAEVQVRIAILNGYTALGIPVAKAVE